MAMTELDFDFWEPEIVPGLVSKKKGGYGTQWKFLLAKNSSVFLSNETDFYLLFKWAIMTENQLWSILIHH